MATINGTAGNDTLNGTAASDTINGFAGDDILNGGDGSDILIGGAGADALFGGAGLDYASYSTSAVAMTINLATGVLTGDGAGDTFDGIEAFIGTGLADTFIAGAGADNLDGGAGNDILSYAASTAAVNVDMTLQTGSGGYAQGDTFRNFEKVVGSDYDDTLTSRLTGTALEGGAGNDTYVVIAAVTLTEAAGGGDDQVITTSTIYTLGANIERLTFSGTSAFTGTGNALANVITGGSGADTLDGAAGDDTLVGGQGNDLLYGGAGADIMNGGDGTDTVSYRLSGSVTINLSTGASTGDAAGDTYISIERFVGSSLNDVLIAGNNADIFDGGTGTDIVSYTDSTAAVSVNLTTGVGSGGYAAGDMLTSVERVVGSSFNDTLTSSTSGHTLEGGAGDDLYIVSGGALVSESAGGGVDTVQTSLTTYTLASNLERLVYSGSAAFNGNGNEDANEIIGGIGADNLNGKDGDDVLSGGDGDDILVGGAGADVLNGGAGTDTARYINAVTINTATGVHGGEAAGDVFNSIEIIQGSTFDDTFISGAGADRFDGNTGTDVLSYAASTSGVNVNITTNTASGGYAEGDVISGFERLEGSAFNDTLGAAYPGRVLAGGAGDDTYLVGHASVVVEEYGAGGVDTIQTILNSFSLASVSNIENLTYTGIYGFIGTGDGGANVIRGDQGADTLDGAGGDDTLLGGDGDDILIGGAGADHLVGGAGTDTVRYASAVTIDMATGAHSNDAAGDTFDGVEIIQGSSSSDTFISGAAADRFDGAAGTDTLSYAASTSAVTVNLTTGTASGGYAQGDIFSNFEKVIGSAGADTLASSTNGHTLAGGAGDDTYVVGANVIIQEDADAGIDTITTALASYSMSTAANVENLVFTGSGNFTGQGNSENNVLTGGGGNDNLLGWDGNDVLNGGAGNDEIQGGDGDDILNGGDGDDSLYGGAGADQLIGGAGFDTARYLNAVTIDMLTGLHGGDASGDTFVGVEAIQGSSQADTFIAGAGADNFQAIGGVDLIDYSASTSGVSVNLTTGVASGGYATGDVVTGFETVIGTGLADTLASSTSGHTLNGGDGDDTYIVGATGITILDTAGDDTIQSLLNTFSLAGYGQIERLVGSNAGFTGTGNALDNVLTGGAGNDVLTGGFGADTLIGGAGFDTASYADSTTSLTIDLSGSTPTVNGIGTGDTFNSIEKFVASFYNDTIFAGASVDNVDAGSGIDLVSYRFSSAGITIQLASPSSNGGDAAGDVFVGAEIYEGSAFADVLYGDTASNTFIGGSGADTIEGGGSVDSIWYLTSTAAVAVNLATHSGSGGDAAGDTISGVENVLGSLYDDTLIGDASANKLEGGAGNDTIDGGDGDDVIYGSWITDTGPLGTANPGPQADVLNGGAGNDTILTNYQFSPTLDAGSIVHGDAGNDIITVGSAYAFGDDGDDTITGGQGYTIDGGAGADIIIMNGIGSAEGAEGGDTYRVYTTAIVNIHDGGTAGTDQIRLFNIANGADLRYRIEGDDLLVTNASDAADGSFDSGVRVVGYYAGGGHSIELFYTADGASYTIP